jgi:hypothetical protein
MRITVFLALAAALTLSVSAADDWQPAKIVPPDWPAEIKARNAEMKARVDAWLQDSDADASPLYIVYLSCSDQKPFPGYKERLNRVMTEVQTWFRVQHDACGFGPVTFRMERDAAGLVKLHEAKLPFTVKSRTRDKIRETHKACNAAAREVLAKAGVDYGKSYVLVLTTIPDDHGAAPFFGNIIQDRGYCFAVDALWVDSEYTKTDGPKVWKGKTAGPANSALIGGIAHELGHGFGLPHCDEHAEQRKLQYGESLMGSGNYTWRNELRGKGKGSFLLDTDGALLISRAPFVSRTRALRQRPVCSVEGIHLEQDADKLVTVTGTVKSDIPVYCVKVFDDPPNGGDYNAVCKVAVPDAKTGEFKIQFTPLAKPGDHELRLVLYHVSGRWTTQKVVMQVQKDRTANLATARRELLRLPAPALVKGDTCNLARAKTASAKLGWGRLLTGKTPEGPLKVGGKHYADGLFAHSPSRVTYDLGGKWKTFTVTAGLQDGTAKKATFKVLGDGKELKVLKDQVGGAAITVDISKVKTLELITDPGAGGNRSSWTIWAEPVLKR